MGDRVGGAAFCGRRHGKNLVFCQALCCFNMLHVEDAFRQRTCFIEYNRIDLGQGFQIVAPFHEDTVLEAAPMPPKNDKGMETTRAQGQEMTRNTKARLSHSAQEAWKRRGGTMPSARAAMTTAGV